MLDRLIGYHCGPALAGIKPANIISIPRDKYPETESDIAGLNDSLNLSGIYFEILCCCDKNALVMVYRENKLIAYLTRPEIADFLTRYGYDKNFDLNGYIETLKKRIRGNTEFPHEIGAFLGYPIEDIEGFINHKNDGCVYTGYWKVYGNAEAKIKLFRRYDVCRNNILTRVCGGTRLVDLFGTA